MWITVQVEYEPVNPLANKQPFEQYLSAAPTRMFKCDKKNLWLCKPLYQQPPNSNRSDQEVKREVHPRLIRTSTRQNFAIHLENGEVRAT